MARTGIAAALACVLLLCAAGTGFAEVVLYSFGLDCDPGWTREGGWAHGVPDVCCESTDNDPHTGGAIFGNGLTTGYATGSTGEALTTGMLDCTGARNVTLRFWSLIGLANGDDACVEVSNDGSSWVTLYTHESAGCYTDCAWQLCEYDISAVADGQPTVYVRWVMGPLDGGCSCWGWRIDDVQIVAESSSSVPYQILAWTRYADLDWTYAQTLTALDEHLSQYVVTETETADGAVLATELTGKHALLVPGIAVSTPAELAEVEAAGTAFADTLQSFVANGGTVVVCGAGQGSSMFLTATGLMAVAYHATYPGGADLAVVAPAHPVAAGLGTTVVSQYATGAYSIGSGTTPVVADGSGKAVVACRDVEYGAATLVGYDYWEYDESAALILANAILYPRSHAKVLVYDEDTVQSSALEAAGRLGLRHTRAGASDFNSLLASDVWDAVVVDCPSMTPEGGWDPLIGHVAGGGKAALSTWVFGSEPSLAAAFEVSSAASVAYVPPIYTWSTAPPLFSDPESVPDLLTWADYWGSDADRLVAVNGCACPVAGYAEYPTEGEAALVVGNRTRTIANGFLWDDHDQDDDSDGIEDAVELVMNEITMLLRRPEAEFSASVRAGAAPLEVSFTDESLNVPTSWCWDFGDDSWVGGEQNPAHIYAEPGTYTVSLAVGNRYGADCVQKVEHIEVAIAPVANFVTTPSSGAVPLRVEFTDTSTNTPTLWSWDFGDGGTSAEQHPSHEYTSIGSYTVSLTVSNVAGSDTETKTNCIRVAAVPTANFAFTPTSGVVPMLVQFTDLSSNSPTSWRWDFGDGGTSSSQNPSHEYGEVGMYTVALMAGTFVGSDAETKTRCVAVGFPDVGPGHWAFRQTIACYEGGIVLGYEDGNYHPTIPVTRAQMAAYISRAMVGGDDNVPDGPEVATFLDVPPDDWAYDYIEYAYSQKVVVGYDDGTYGPAASVIRGQMAAFVARALVAPGGDDAIPDPLPPATFSDVQPDNDWAWCYKQVEYIARRGVVQGYGDGTYRPANPVSRDQMAVYIQRAFELPI